MNKYLSEYERNRKWMEEHDWDGCLWPEEATFVEAFEKGQAVERTKAFGAIRHAAKIAREFDERGIWDPELWITADAIRRAIRAAIGTEKA